MNLVAGGLGGVPMCHGAGGMAGHIRFGARTGGAAVLLGVLLLATALLLGDSVTTLLKLCPVPVLGVILFFGGLELAAGAQGGDTDAQDRYVVMVTAAIAMWNMGAGYLAGLVLWYAMRGNWLRL
jgi:MFS superfamily sulfate permease-like transporter